VSLSPVEAIYARFLEARAKRYASGKTPSFRLAHPVVSVGNITLGGTGKTPFVQFLASYFRAQGRRPAILSRGYGRRSRGLVIVSEGSGPRVAPDEGGDEPVALARRLEGVPIVVAERRVDAGRAAEKLGVDLHLLDDGYQHLALERDVNLLLLDAQNPFGGGRFPPFGRLREPLSALRRADAFVLTRSESSGVEPSLTKALADQNADAPIFTARIRPDGITDEKGADVPPEGIRESAVVAVCGVAQPASFDRTLSDLGIAAHARLTFPDHHFYGPRDVSRIAAAASSTGSRAILTTEKDAVKLLGRLPVPLWSLRVTVEVAGAEFFRFLTRRVPSIVSSTLPDNMTRSRRAADDPTDRQTR
jgi:tetraacyldisaccharide 4'-kinase